jgi:hypothetical protein
MHIEALLAAACARGLAAYSRTSVARYHDVIEHALGLVANEIVIAALKLGYPDPAARESGGDAAGESVGGFARLLGFPD